MKADRNRGFVLEGMACAIVDRALVSWFVVEVSQEGRRRGGLSDYDLAYVRRWLYNGKRSKRYDGKINPNWTERMDRTRGWMDDAAGSAQFGLISLGRVKRGR
jgi:hypothetical protein